MKIKGTGSVLPKKIVTNDMLSEFLDTSDQWIASRTGVRSRKVISDEKLEDMAVEADLLALDEGLYVGSRCRRCRLCFQKARF